MKQKFEELKKDFPQIGPYNEPPVNAQGYTQFQLWCLMNTFGPEMYNGNPELPFDADIIIGEG